MKRVSFVLAFALAFALVLALPVAAHGWELGDIPMFQGGPTPEEALNLDEDGRFSPVPPDTAVTFGGMWCSMTKGLAKTAPLQTLLALEIYKDSFDGDLVVAVSQKEFMDCWTGEHLPTLDEWWDPVEMGLEPFNSKLGCKLYYNDWFYTIDLEPGVYYVHAMGEAPRTAVDLLAWGQEHGVMRFPPGTWDAYYYFTVQ